LVLRALRIRSPNQTEPFPSTVSSAWFSGWLFTTFDLVRETQAVQDRASIAPNLDQLMQAGHPPRSAVVFMVMVVLSI
jgi:hypothetical protein